MLAGWYDEDAQTLERSVSGDGTEEMVEGGSGGLGL